ncbi:MAG: hypothetical protein JW991_04405 [Candidatus Pacebacteria bacterium]|nr:hypothetical protein [Candidatus Paceibacterota bacterium]
MKKLKLLLLVLLSLAGPSSPAAAGEEKLESNLQYLTVIFDLSDSRSQTGIEQDRQSADQMLDRLAEIRPQSLVSVIVFNDDTRVVCHAVSPDQARTCLAGQDLTKKGNTLLSRALKEGLDLSWKVIPEIGASPWGVAVFGDGQADAESQSVIGSILLRGGVVWYFQSEVTGQTPPVERRLEVSRYLLSFQAEEVDSIVPQIEVQIELTNPEIQPGEEAVFVIRLLNLNPYPVWGWVEISLEGAAGPDIWLINLGGNETVEMTAATDIAANSLTTDAQATVRLDQGLEGVVSDSWPILPLASFGQETFFVEEGNRAVIIVELERAPQETVQGTVSITPISAEAGVDYEMATAISFRIEPPETRKRVSLRTLQDNRPEGDETISLSFFGMTGAAIDPEKGQAILVILDDDEADLRISRFRTLGPISPGRRANFQVGYQNIGPATAAAEIWGEFPPECPYQGITGKIRLTNMSLHPGETGELSFSCLLGESATRPFTLTSEIKSDLPDPIPEDNTAIVAVTILPEGLFLPLAMCD